MRRRSLIVAALVALVLVGTELAYGSVARDLTALQRLSCCGSHCVVQRVLSCGTSCCRLETNDRSTTVTSAKPLSQVPKVVVVPIYKDRNGIAEPVYLARNKPGTIPDRSAPIFLALRSLRL